MNGEAEVREAHEKYKELFELSKELLAEEQGRYSRLDQKAAMYLSAITIVASLYALVASSLWSSLAYPLGVFSIILLAYSLVLAVFMLVAWFEVFRAARVVGIMRMPLDIQFFDDNRTLDIHYALARGNKRALKVNMKVNQLKSERLARGYRFIRLTVVGIAVFLLLFGFYRLLGVQENGRRHAATSGAVRISSQK